jgi:SH3 domain protein
MLLSTGVLAETTVYVGDQVKIPMRANDAIAKNNVINHLTINTPVTLIKKQANGWSHIKHDGKQGWMISRYLTDKKPAKKLTKTMQYRLKHLDASNKGFKEINVKLQKQIQDQEIDITRLNLEIIQRNTESLGLNKLQNKLFDLDEANTDLMDQVTTLKSANSSLHTTDFLTIISAVTLLLGFGIGMGMSRSRSNRDNTIYKL